VIWCSQKSKRPDFRPAALAKHHESVSQTLSDVVSIEADITKKKNYFFFFFLAFFFIAMVVFLLRER
jgi:hypothetical protein